MGLHNYTKTQTHNHALDKEGYMILDPIDNDSKRTTMWSILQDTHNLLKEIVKKSTMANILLPTVFIVAGVFFIYQEFFPDIQQLVQQYTGFYTAGNLSPVEDQYVNLAEYISRPTDLSKLTSSALSLNILEADTISKSYKGIFYISIPSIGIDKMAVQANVDSTTEESYLKVLDKTLAHFENTGLPISDVKNNIVVYGHSASPNYGPKPTDPVVAFSFLPNLKVGDDIFIDMDGKRFHYKMYRSKIVEPEDTSIITGTRGKQTLTLFTCFPAGSPDYRYIAVARPV